MICCHNNLDCYISIGNKMKKLISEIVVLLYLCSNSLNNLLVSKIV